MKPLLREQLLVAGLRDADPERDRQRSALLETVLRDQQHTFQFFVTATFLTPQPLSDAVDQVHELLDGLSRNRFLKTTRRLQVLAGQTPMSHARGRIKYFYSLSLDQRHQWAFADAHTAEVDDLVSRWHVHLLVAGQGRRFKPEDIMLELELANFGKYFIRPIFDVDHVARYMMREDKGNRVGKLQKTNDRTIRDALERHGHLID